MRPIPACSVGRVDKRDRRAPFTRSGPRGWKGPSVLARDYQECLDSFIERERAREQRLSANTFPKSGRVVIP